jgi:FkbM family methyltransferase
MGTQTFTYNSQSYTVLLNSSDPSTNGCIQEIVKRNEYRLEQFATIENGTFIDIGANCGIATIILAKQNPNSLVYSFEPDPSVFKVLEENVKLNNLSNVILFNKAMCRKETKTIELCLHPSYSGGNTTCADKAVFTNNTIVECVSFDEIIETYKISKIDLLKIDCEGAEYEILYESERFKERIVKAIVGEFHNLSYNTKITNYNYNANNLVEYCKLYVDKLLPITILNI